MNFRKAKPSDVKRIYHFWHKVKKSSFRIFGLEDSIFEGAVFVTSDNEGEIFGFVRFNLNSNKTNDYIKINEIALNIDMFGEEQFQSMVRAIIFKFGYTTAKATVVLEELKLFERLGWKFEGIKSKISGEKSYHNVVIRCDIQSEDARLYDNLTEWFGEYI